MARDDANYDLVTAMVFLTRYCRVYNIEPPSVDLTFDNVRDRLNFEFAMRRDFDRDSMTLTAGLRAIKSIAGIKVTLRGPCNVPR